MKILSSLAIALALCFSTLATSALAEKVKPTYQYQKPGAPIRLAEPNLIQMEPHSTKSVTISFQAPSAGELSISAKPSPGINIDDTNQHNFDLATSPPSLTLQVDSQEEGLYNIMFQASISDNGPNMHRVFGIAVQVGNPPASTKQKASAPYVIMKAEETIK